MRKYSVSDIISMVDHEIGYYIKELIDHNFHKVSDGCTVVSEVVVEEETGKDMICMLHDWLYYTGTVKKEKADRMLFYGYKQTGYFWVGLRRYMYFFFGGGEGAWDMHRKFGHSLNRWRQHLQERVRNHA